MKKVNRNYIDGAFVPVLGTDTIELRNPANEEVIATVLLSNEQDALQAIEAATQAFTAFSQSTVQQRMDYLQKLHDAIVERLDDLKEATIIEYGATEQRALWANRYAADTFLYFKNVLGHFSFERKMGESTVVLEPVGVTAIFTSWNSNAGSICVKLAAAIAAGCTVVIKPSEFSALQTQVLVECFHKAGLPAGVINVLNGRGDVLGEILTTHPAIARITFTGSTAVGKIIARNAAGGIKRLTLELSGKSPNIILDDADLDTAIPMAVQNCFQNNGQACVAGSRLIVPEKLLPQVKELVVKTIATIKVGDPVDVQTTMGPLANAKQYERVQHYINAGIESGAELLAGGPGKPEGLSKGYFVKPTAFVSTSHDIVIAREEIFGPVLTIFTYNTEEEATRLANDTVYGLQAYISSSNTERAHAIARQIQAGRVLINTLQHDPYSPFGGFKQSGLGREGGIYGLEAQLEPKAILG